MEERLVGLFDSKPKQGTIPPPICCDSCCSRYTAGPLLLIVHWAVCPHALSSVPFAFPFSMCRGIWGLMIGDEVVDDGPASLHDMFTSSRTTPLYAAA